MTPDLVIKALLAGTVDLARSGTHFGMIAARPRRRAQDHRRLELRLPLPGHQPAAVQNPCRSKGTKIAAASLASITTTIFKDVMQRQGIPPSAYTLLFVGGSPERFQAVASGAAAASLAEAPPFNFRSIDAGRKVLLNYSDEIKNLQYTSIFASDQIVSAKPPAVRPLHERDGPGDALVERSGQ